MRFLVPVQKFKKFLQIKEKYVILIWLNTHTDEKYKYTGARKWVIRRWRKNQGGNDYVSSINETAFGGRRSFWTSNAQVESKNGGVYFYSAQRYLHHRSSKDVQKTG